MNSVILNVSFASLFSLSFLLSTPSFSNFLSFFINYKVYIL